MNAERLLAHYDRIADAPDAIARLRRFILDLAVRGKLVPQDPTDEPASELLKRIAKEKARLVKAGEIRKPKSLAPVNRRVGEDISGWTWVRLGEVSTLITKGSTPTSYGHAYTDEGVNFVKVESIRDGVLRPEYITSFISDETNQFLARSRLADGDMLFSIAGSIGTCAVVTKIVLPANTNQALAIIRGTQWAFASEFLLKSLRSSLASAILEKARGGAMNNVSLEDIQNFVVPLPPLAEQQRIVAKVNELMGLCDRLEAVRASREGLRDRLAAASFARLNTPDPETFGEDTRFVLNALPSLITRPDQIKALRQTILNLAVRGRLCSARFGELKRVGAFRSLQNGYAFKSEWFGSEGVRLLRNANVGHGDLRWDDTVYLTRDQAAEYERFALLEGDIVLTLDRPFIVTGTKVARVKANDLPSLLLQRVGRFVETAPGLSDDYLFLWINSPHFNEQIDPGRSNGVPHISSRQVEAAEIFVPSVADQHRIVAKVDELMGLCDRLEASLTATAATRRRLLDALLAESLAPTEVRELQAAE